MGLLNFIKSQFIEVIEWTDSTNNTIVYRFPVQGKEIKMGAQLTVRESQVAVFINEGRIADVFQPGRYQLTTENMPVMTKLYSWKYGFNSPFKAEIYFVNTKQFTEQKWGTSNPIMMRDADFGMLRLRAFGIFSFKVIDAVKLLKEIFGTQDVFETEEIIGQLKRTIISGLTDTIGESKIPALDLAMHYDELGKSAKDKLQTEFDVFGLQLTSMFIENISLPEEVEKVMDKRTSMGVLGNMQQYAQYQAAEAMRDMAQHPGSGSTFMDAGLGLSAGAAMGQAMNQAFNGMNQPQAPQANTMQCPHCKANIAAGSKFCPNCGKSTEAPKSKCIKCSAELAQGAKFCPECGAPQKIERICSKCGVKVNGDVKFCAECGTKVE